MNKSKYILVKLTRAQAQALLDATQDLTEQDEAFDLFEESSARLRCAEKARKLLEDAMEV